MVKLKPKKIDNQLSDNKKKKVLFSQKRISKLFIKRKYVSPLSFIQDSTFYFKIKKLLKIFQSKEFSEELLINEEDINLLNNGITTVENKIKKMKRLL